ncbi:MAG: hypothetical protein BWY97_00455 [Tenericutes bacterium ADurb.BinA124]|nr:MAG: hypothetical protein BWY97_00455 [Tenericutes bacterium ADurb.BinA124]
MHFYISDVLQKETNSYYPHEIKVVDIDSLKKAVSKDYVCAKYKNFHRSNADFVIADTLALDCDNTHTEDESKWVDIKAIKEMLPGVSFAVHYSRNNMKEKQGKKARPKFHIFFPIEPIKNYEDYRKLKEKILSIYPFFDFGAKDAARFFYGTSEPQVEWVDGDMNILEFLDENKFAKLNSEIVIEEGGRNTYLSHLAARLLVRFGECDETYNSFVKANDERCNPPVEDNELKMIWGSALNFYRNTVLKNPNYVTPEKYNDDKSYRPDDFTDLGQATVLKNTYESCLRYSPSTKFLVYTNGYWQESEEKAQRLVQKLTDKQLKEALTKIANLNKKLENGGVFDVISTLQKGENLQDKISKDLFNDVQELETNKQYLKFVYKRRDSKYISATLKEVRPIVEIMPSELNKNPYLLNTPSGTFDLRKGLGGFSEHKAEDFITKITTVSPGNKGKDLWLDCLDKIYGDAELIDYVQKICGLAVIGKVFIEAMIIAYGDGGNGKSTFWNAIFRVLGNYSGKLSADALTTSVRRNVKPEMAEMAGRRLLIASESQEGARLNESMIKQLCSTDEVMAEKKYKDPFYFTPTHMLVLYTNHLPRISGSDDGIWRRLIVIPYTRKLTGKDDIKNYADYLYENAGEYILSWLIEGAKKVIDSKFRIAEPKVVTDAIKEYKEQSNWFNHFIEDCCEVGKGYEVSSSQLYSSYRAYCSSIGEYPRSTSDFYTALEKNGFKKEVKKRIKYIKGLKLIDSTVTDFEEFLT